MSKWIDGNKIAISRKQKQMKQTELANRVSITQSVISRMKCNMKVDYKLSIVIEVASVLGVSIEDIIKNNVFLDQERKIESELR